jgi:hypothetical protein
MSFVWYTNGKKIINALEQVVINHGGRVKEKPETSYVFLDGYTNFILDDDYYYFQIDDNPFFPFYYTKTPIKNNKYSKDVYMEESKKEYLYDCFFEENPAQEDIKEAANILFNELTNAKYCEKSRHFKKIRVSNTYDAGYHYEKVYDPERIVEIDF